MELKQIINLNQNLFMKIYQFKIILFMLAQISDINNLILGSSCIYPKFAKQPIKEKYLLSGELEPTNQYYALAKIAGIKLCESYNIQHGRNYICLMPSNLFGPNDNYNLNNSHFLPAVIKKYI